jgi:hypothetical protein
LVPRLVHAGIHTADDFPIEHFPHKMFADTISPSRCVAGATSLGRDDDGWSVKTCYFRKLYTILECFSLEHEIINDDVPRYILSRGTPVLRELTSDE